MGGAVVSPLVYFTNAENSILSFAACGIYTPQCESVYSTVFVSILGALSSFLALVSIFLYKNRKRQIKVVNMNAAVIVLFYIALGAYLYLAQTQGFVFESVQYGIVLPFIALVFNILALKKIKADEKLVRSLDRIR